MVVILKGHAGAINALGWYALEIKDNRTHARDLFMKGRKLGNADAIHNIGHMYIGARYPGTPYVDRVSPTPQSRGAKIQKILWFLM